MVSSDKKLANVVGGKTARACDNCIRKRARWYCAADDAFLCQSCDASVHSVNPLARRHERVRLKVAYLKLSSLEKPVPPPWHHGFTKKPRTPRGGTHHKQASRRTPKSEESSLSFNPLHLVPEIGSDEATALTSEEQLLYQVPIFDPFAAELCLSGNSNEVATPPVKPTTPVEEEADHHDDYGSKVTFDLNSFNGLVLPSDMELAEFAADVESLLGKGLDEESFAMEGLGLLDCREKDSGDHQSLERVKIEEDQMMQCETIETEMEMMREPFQLSFDYDSPLWEEKDEKVIMVEGGGGDDHHMGHVVIKEDEDDDVVINIDKYDDDEKKKNKRILKLDYEGIIAAWDEQRSPWTTGDRPELDPDDCWPECMGGCGIMHHHHNHHHPYGDMGMMTGNPAMLDGGREARVSRYREKRRTRLFSKKIRYEVRKLNAEKRPRMKGRFVKRSSSSTGFPLLSK